MMPGVVDEDVEAAKAADDRRRPAAGHRAIAQIAGHGSSPGARAPRSAAHVPAGDRELPCAATSAPASASAIAIAAPSPADARR